MKEPITALRKGQGTGKIVFIHGNMASAKWWMPVMDALASRYEMLAVNLRGFGDGPDTPEVVSLADHARDIYELVHKHSLEHFVLAGHSLGGGVAMQFAAEYPDLLSGLVLVDSTPIGGMQEIDYALLQMVVENKELAVASLKGTLVKMTDENLLNELMVDALRALPAVIPNTRALEGADFTGKAAAFHKPVFVIHGELDVLVPAVEAEKAYKAYPNGQLKIIPGVGHNPQVEDTKAFTTALQDFVSRLGQ